MIDRDNGHESSVIVDLVDDAEVAATGTVFAFEIESESVTDSVWILRESAVHELDACDCDLLGQLIERPKGTRCPVDAQSISKGSIVTSSGCEQVRRPS